VTTHFIIPDTQVKPGVPLDHLAWIGQYIAERRPDRVIHLGDHWDFPSLSSYDKGKKAMEGRRVQDDIDAGNYGMELLTEPIFAPRNRKYVRTTDIELYLLRGNHEYRLNRAVNDDAQLDGVLGEHLLESPGWTVIPFEEVLELDGVRYSHYFYNPNTGRPYAGANIETRLKTIGCSFTMGHQQGLKVGMMPTISGMKRGLVAGTCYLHDEDYLGPQGNQEWRGVIVCHEVADGDYSLMEVSLDYLCRRYEGVSLSEYTPTLYWEASA
jgi:hypothetical protein